MPRLDRVTRAFWRAVGRPVDLAGEHSWLDAPMHAGPLIGDGWLAHAAAMGGRVVEGSADAGLLREMADLDGPGFDAGDLAAQVRDFYEHTARWRMEVWTQWTPVFQPGGDLVARYFGRRVHQLALPMRPLDVAHGMDSRVALLLGPDGRQQAAGWIRTLRRTGDYVYSGCYSSRRLPGADRPSVHVTFPLEEGNVQVFLRPRALPGGALELSSPPGRFGVDGAYVVVRVGGATYAARAPIHETFRVYVDRDGELRTDHDLRMWSATAVRLHYKLERRPGLRGARTQVRHNASG